MGRTTQEEDYQTGVADTLPGVMDRHPAEFWYGGCSLSGQPYHVKEIDL